MNVGSSATERELSQSPGASPLRVLSVRRGGGTGGGTGQGEDGLVGLNWRGGKGLFLSWYIHFLNNNFVENMRKFSSYVKILAIESENFLVPGLK